MTIAFALICAGVGLGLGGGFAGFMAWRQPTLLAIEIAESIRTEPQRWKQGSHTLDRDDGLEIWTSNGISHVRIYAPRKIDFCAADRKLIFKACKTVGRDMTLASLMGKP